ncbi:hypothetical protein AAY24_08020 [Sedimenticola thiotaurini]|uniref:Uncharacterized protein n=1 Tax=Sedimenticola thiotaurini TaxID=1543721 RepID=A0A0F7JZE9_9GAMM|nr:hypothetical protein AAY24_08020 [Sedimenticola thiotaurini]
MQHRRITATGRTMEGGIMVRPPVNRDSGPAATIRATETAGMTTATAPLPRHRPRAIPAPHPATPLRRENQRLVIRPMVMNNLQAIRQQDNRRQITRRPQPGAPKHQPRKQPEIPLLTTRRQRLPGGRRIVIG